MSQVWSSVVSLPGFTLRSVAWLLQGNVAQETRREGAERRTRDGECEEKCRGGKGLNLNHRKKTVTPRAFLFFFLFPFLPCFLPVKGGAGRNCRNATGVFSTFAPVQHRDTQLYSHIDIYRPAAMHGGLTHTLALDDIWLSVQGVFLGKRQ